MANSIIAVLGDPSDIGLVRESVRGQQIALQCAQNSEDALRSLAGSDTTVVLYDADTGQPWRDALPRFLHAHPGCRVILLCHNADERMWADLFEGGGFDLVLKAVRPSDLRRIIRAALNPPACFFRQSAA